MVCALHANLQFGLISLFLHDFENHAACFRGSLWGGMDGDRLLCSPGVLLSMDVYPAGKESGAIAQRHLGLDPSPKNASHWPMYSKDTDRPGSVTSTFATNAILQEGGKQCRGSCAKPKFSAAPLRRESFLQECHWAKAPRQRGNEASLVNEVCCVVFPMILEVKSKVSGIILHVGTVPVSELIAAFKSHMLIQLHQIQASFMYLSMDRKQRHALSLPKFLVSLPPAACLLPGS